jgi:hypothetical protein
VSLVSATLNGAAIASPTIVVNSSNPSEPLFTISQSIQPGKFLVIKFHGPGRRGVQPGTYWNSFQLEYEGKVIPPIPEAPVTVAGGKIGDTIWRDWNGDGVQDPGEEGIAGRDRRTLRRRRHDPAATTTTTDANGNYYFPGLIDGHLRGQGHPAGRPPRPAIPTARSTTSTRSRWARTSSTWPPTSATSRPAPVPSATWCSRMSATTALFNSGTDTGIAGVTVHLYADANNGIYTGRGSVLISLTTTGQRQLLSSPAWPRASTTSPWSIREMPPSPPISAWIPSRPPPPTRSPSPTSPARISRRRFRLLAGRSPVDRRPGLPGY